jgi:hypothetical protein
MSHFNYYLIIRYLIGLKDEFHKINDNRYKTVIEELSSYEVYPHSDNEHLPDHKALASKFNYSQVKFNSILRDLLKELVSEFHYTPLKINNMVIR